jgi:putative tryptophan/tyrosine transport system substrate-binding protein
MIRILALLLSASVPAARPTEAPRIVVVLSADAAPYQQALAGLRRELLAAIPSADFVVVTLGGDTARIVDAIRVIRSGPAPAALVVTLGTLATRGLIARVPDIPIVAGMILTAAELDGAPNATGVYLEYPVEVELEWLQRVLPDYHRIGVLYHGAESGRRVAQALRLAAASGGKFKVEAVRVDGPADLPTALTEMTNRADVLWSLNEPVVYNPETARSLLLFSLRNRIPLVGQSPAWVRAGALYALERDYDDVGAQCANEATRILRGEAAATLPAAPPRKVRYALNRRTAAELRLTFSDAILHGAVEVVN